MEADGLELILLCWHWALTPWPNSITDPIRTTGNQIGIYICIYLHIHLFIYIYIPISVDTYLNIFFSRHSKKPVFSPLPELLLNLHTVVKCICTSVLLFTMKDLSPFQVITATIATDEWISTSLYSYLCQVTKKLKEKTS